MKKISWYYKFIIFKLRRKINLDILNLSNKKSLNEIFNYFGTDKGTKIKNPYSKNSKKKELGHGFGKFYENISINSEKIDLNF